MDWQKASAELERKLDPKNVKPAQKFGPKGDYIEGWHAMAEANRIFGHGEWSYIVASCNVVQERPREIGREKKEGFGVTYVATVRVTVGDVIREDVGAGHGYDVDLGLAHESAIKEAVTDALKRGLRSFGNPFGLALYDKTRENVGVDDQAEKQKPRQITKAEPSDADLLRNKMVAGLREKGAGLADFAPFKADLERLRKLSVELAASVEAEIETQKQGAAA
jgi:DNA recombination protein Rad52